VIDLGRESANMLGLPGDWLMREEVTVFRIRKKIVGREGGHGVQMEERFLKKTSALRRANLD